MDGKTAKGFTRLREKLKNKETKNKAFWLILIFPALLLCTAFIVIPIIDSVIKSFTDYKIQQLVKGTLGEWNNFHNYIRLFESGKIQSAALITLEFVLVVTPTTFIIGLILALILNSKIIGARFLRSIMMIPWVVPTVITGLLWMWIFSNPYGLLKYFVSLFTNGEVSNFAILDSKQYALFAVMIAALWKQIPLMTLLLLAGLQNVPEDIMEAAKIDGASGFKRLWYILLPEIKSVIKVSISMQLITNFKQYPLFAALTNGGPTGATTTLAVLSYEEAFVSYNYGSGAAVTTLWMVLMVVFIILYNQLFKEKD